MAAAAMRFMKTNTLVVVLVGLGLAGCDSFGARKAFDRHIEVCSLAERNGLLDAAVEACGQALAIAEEQTYAPEQISGLLYRLGRLERQRGKFEEAEALVGRSLALEEQSGDKGALAMRLVELALSMAGQGRWQDGVELLERAAPLVVNLSGDDRETAANAFKGFGARLGALGYSAQAEKFKLTAQELTGS
jgi:tetratricopeptide (TPR) repeat protein